MKYTIIMLAAFLSLGIAGSAQSKDTAANRQMVEAQDFVFKASSVTPMRGTTRYLTSEYDLTIKKDSLSSQLPYFGRVYNAPINPTQSALEFNSSKFDYQVVSRKRNGWEVTIHLKDQSDVKDLILTIFNNGRAELRVNSLNRESISFSGYIVPGDTESTKAF